MEEKYPLRKRIKSAQDISGLFAFNEHQNYRLKEDSQDKPL